MEKRRKSLIINICWKPFFVAMITGILAIKNPDNSILIGFAMGAAGALACNLDIRRLLQEKD